MARVTQNWYSFGAPESYGLDIRYKHASRWRSCKMCKIYTWYPWIYTRFVNRKFLCICRRCSILFRSTTDWFRFFAIYWFSNSQYFGRIFLILQWQTKKNILSKMFAHEKGGDGNSSINRVIDLISLYGFTGLKLVYSEIALNIYI